MTTLQVRDSHIPILWIRKLRLREDRPYNLKFTQLQYPSRWQLPEVTLQRVTDPSLLKTKLTVYPLQMTPPGCPCAFPAPTLI